MRESMAKRDEADAEARAAELRAREAEAAVAGEVEQRLAAACSSRTLW